MKRLIIVVLATACCGCSRFRITGTDRVGELKATLDAQQRELVELTSRIDKIGRTMLPMPPDNRPKAEGDAFRNLAENVIIEHEGLPRICKVYVQVPGIDHAFWTYTITNEVTQVTTERK